MLVRCGPGRERTGPSTQIAGLRWMSQECLPRAMAALSGSLRTLQAAAGWRGRRSPRLVSKLPAITRISAFFGASGTESKMATLRPIAETDASSPRSPLSDSWIAMATPFRGLATPGGYRRSCFRGRWIASPVVVAQPDRVCKDRGHLWRRRHRFFALGRVFDEPWVSQSDKTTTATATNRSSPSA